MGILSAAREHAVQRHGTPSRIVTPGDEVERVVVSTQLVASLRHFGEKGFQRTEALLRQTPIQHRIEQQCGRFDHAIRTPCTRAEMNRAFSVVAQVKLRKFRLVATRESRFGTSLSGQFG